MNRLYSPLIALALIGLAAGCDSERHFAKVSVIRHMAQTIGGPAAAGRPGDYLLENDRIRAIIHGRHNQRSTFPISNGSLVDLDLQRPFHRYGVGRGKDAFYEMGSMVNLRVNSSRQMTSGRCDEVGVAPCPKNDGVTLDCARVTASGPAEDIMGILGLLDFAIKKSSYKSADLRIFTDYDLCPGEATVRNTTTARYFGKGTPVDIEPLKGQTGLLSILLGETLDVNCALKACPAGSTCDDLLVQLTLGSLNTEMKRCRKPQQKLAGVMTGDLMLFSGKVHVFIPGAGFDHETYIRSVFDTGGDIFSSPLSLDYVAAVGDDISYVYYSHGKKNDGKVMIPVFANSFTVSMTGGFACQKNKSDCLKGKELRFRRYVSVGGGDVASALDGYYKMRGIATGQVRGHVIDIRKREPISKINVFALKVPKAWVKRTDGELASKTYDELIAQNAAESKSKAAPLGSPGLVSHFRTDTGLDAIADGSFSGPLPAGRYLLVARSKKTPTSNLVPITIAAGEQTSTTIIVGEHGTLEFDITDAAGRPLPSKLTIGHCFAECAFDSDCKASARPRCDTRSHLCLPKAGYRSPADCRPDQRWSAREKTCVCGREGEVPLELGGARVADGTARTVLTKNGRGALALPPGTYQVVASRGIEYEIHRQYVTLRGGGLSRMKAVLHKAVNTDGWISADFHVHGPNSVDSGLTFNDRVLSYAAEGVELLTATDHDQLTDYAPTIHTLGLRHWLRSQVGLEVSPLDYGHFLGFPLKFDENAELNGGFHWRKQRGNGKGSAPDWNNITPAAIYGKLRERGALGPESTVTAVAHFYDHFTFYGVDGWTLELPAFSVGSFLNQVLSPLKFSADFDALEGFNGKNLDIIRRPTWKEIREYNIGVNRVLGDLNKPYAERQKAWAALSVASQRQFMMRTPSEQKRTLTFNNVDFECRCTADADCGGGGSLCDLKTGGCFSTCIDDSACDKTLVAAGREKCLPVAGGDAGRKRCQRVTEKCSRDTDCVPTWSSRAERCMAIDRSKPTERTCQIACASASDCQPDGARPVCADGYCQQKTVVAADDDDPCPTVRGTIDDWYQMLNAGIRRTMIGNSDSHSVYSGEAGLPRNYVRSSSDLPPAIGLLEIARNVKQGATFATYGPFIDFQINGQDLGSTISTKQGESVSLSIAIQSPMWFDIDRLEIYRNGELIKVISGKADCGASDATCIRSPNASVLNYQQTISDTPLRDSWYTVIAMGVDGKNLSPVYSSTPVARLGIFELIQRLTPLLPPLRSLRTPFSPTISAVRPYAVTNPIWVDVGGDGLTPLKKAPIWAKRSQKKTSALAVGSPTPPPRRRGHDHRMGIGRLRHEARAFMKLVREKKITQKNVVRALNALRFGVQ